jgi:hypothetical protein
MMPTFGNGHGNIQRFEPKKKLGFWIGFGWETQNLKKIQKSQKSMKSKPKFEIRFF